MTWAVLGTVLITGAYAAGIANKGFPVTEGWFEVFARYINAGKLPYRDFELLAPPLYTYILAAITRAFGYDIIVLRIVGVGVFVVIAAMVCLLFSRLFRPWIAMAAACVTVFYLQSEVANVFYDYIRFFDLFACIVCLSLVTHVTLLESKQRRVSWWLIACGVCSGCGS